MLYVIAIIKDIGVRLYNTEVKQYKDIKFSTLEAVLQQDSTAVRNINNGAINSGSKSTPVLVQDRTGKLITVSGRIYTVTDHTDGGRTTIVDAEGRERVILTADLAREHFANAVYNPATKMLEGQDFEVFRQADALQEYVDEMSLFGSDVFDDADIDTNEEGLEYVYRGPKKTTEILIPNGVQSIKKNTFKGVTCTVLELPNTLTTLKQGSLQGINARIVKLHAGALNSIESHAFYDTIVRELYIYGQPKVHQLAFYGGRISRIFALGRTYQDCLSYKPAATTSVRKLK